MDERRGRTLLTVVVAFLWLACEAGVAHGAQYVIHVSVDGLRPDAVTALGPTGAPNFYRLRTEGAFTDNARTDFDYTLTLPDHASQLTGRGVAGPTGHGWDINVDDGTTVHTRKGSYVMSVFDVAHDNGRSTALFTGKDKFAVFDRSWDGVNGAPDLVGTDDGVDKIDTYVFNGDTTQLVADYVTAMTSAPFAYSLLHLRDPDTAGHGSGWDTAPGSDYLASVGSVDTWLGDLLALVEGDINLAGKTAIVLTADHGGINATHSPASEPANYTIPFYVWGAGVADVDLYSANVGSRLDPGGTRPGYDDPLQPIRNGDAPNLALGLLGLGSIPGSTINAGRDLTVVPEASSLCLVTSVLAWLATSRRLHG